MCCQNGEHSLIDLKCSLQNVERFLTHDDATHTPEARLFCKHFFGIAMAVDSVGRSLTVFEESEKTTGFPEGHGVVQFPFERACDPFAVWGFCFVCSTDVVHGLELPRGNGERREDPILVHQVANIFLRIDDQTIAGFRLPVFQGDLRQEANRMSPEDYREDGGSEECQSVVL